MRHAPLRPRPSQGRDLPEGLAPGVMDAGLREDSNPFSVRKYLKRLPDYAAPVADVVRWGGAARYDVLFGQGSLPGQALPWPAPHSTAQHSTAQHITACCERPAGTRRGSWRGAGRAERVSVSPKVPKSGLHSIAQHSAAQHSMLRKAGGHEAGQLEGCRQG